MRWWMLLFLVWILWFRHRMTWSSCPGALDHRADAIRRTYGGACLQMRVSCSPLAPVFLFLMQWLDCTCSYSLLRYLGLFQILVHKVLFEPFQVSIIEEGMQCFGSCKTDNLLAALCRFMLMVWELYPPLKDGLALESSMVHNLNFIFFCVCSKGLKLPKFDIYVYYPHTVISIKQNLQLSYILLFNNSRATWRKENNLTRKAELKRWLAGKGWKSGRSSLTGIWTGTTSVEFVWKFAPKWSCQAATMLCA